MTSNAPAIRPGSRVRLHLAIYLEDGTEAISTFGEAPMELTLGDGALTGGTERLLIGLSTGSTELLVDNGSELFGQWTEENLHWLARDDFPDGEVPEPGSLVVFDTPGGTEMAGIIKEIEAERVCVDFNHPLSGRALRIQVQVLEVSDPMPSENIH